jgi:hypothetical protein
LFCVAMPAEIALTRAEGVRPPIRVTIKNVRALVSF